MKVLHVLDHYKPHFSGYTFRSSYILKNQQKMGIEPVVVTSPKHGEYDSECEEFDGLKVYRTPCGYAGSLPFIGEYRLMRALEKRIEEVVVKEKPQIIHAHSPSLNGWPAARVAKKNNIPMAYEIRAFWEDAAVDKGSFREGDLKYRLSRQFETSLMRRADAIFTICEGLKEEIIGRGIVEDKLTVIPNCVDLIQFKSVPYDIEIAKKYSLLDKFVFGFIGSHYYFEGLNILVEAFAEIAKKCPQACVLIAGDGPGTQKWVEVSRKLGSDKQILFIGKVPHEEVSRYYSVIDAVVYPRLSMRLTELVTPLKPLEAMALGKVVIGSDVGGIKELVKDGMTGYLFKAGSVHALAETMLKVIASPEGLNILKSQALEYVQLKRSWEIISKDYCPVYSSLVL
jgi:PEP-CTERM/exosortase A-associated glycosyltransferase